MIESPDIIRRLKALVEHGGSFMALFDRALVQRSRALELIEVLEESLPEEIDLANDILERQEKILDEARKQAGEIVDEAVRRSERLVDADAVTLEARKRAKIIKEDADKYVIGRLGRVEKELMLQLENVRSGIRSMSALPEIPDADEDNGEISLDNL